MMYDIYETPLLSDEFDDYLFNITDNMIKGYKFFDLKYLLNNIPSIQSAITSNNNNDLVDLVNAEKDKEKDVFIIFMEKIGYEYKNLYIDNDKTKKGLILKYEFVKKTNDQNVDDVLNKIVDNIIEIYKNLTREQKEAIIQDELEIAKETNNIIKFVNANDINKKKEEN